LATLQSAFLPMIHSQKTKMLEIIIPSEPAPRQVELLPVIDTCREVESKHSLKSSDGRIRPTAAFLRDLARKLSKLLNLKKPLASGAAWQIWITAFDHYEKLAKDHANDAEIAFWYKLDPFNMQPDHKAALIANLARVKAQDTLHRGDFDAGDYKGAYNLVLLATGDEQKALHARANAMEVYEARATARRTK
jgi:hypothetical protein